MASPMTDAVPSDAEVVPDGGGDAAAHATSSISSATLRLWNAFPSLPTEVRRSALAVGAVEAVAAGTAFTVSNEVAVVVSGCFTARAGSTSLIADILAPGDVLAFGAPRAVSAFCVFAGEIYRLPFGDWVEAAGSAGVRYLLQQADRRRSLAERRLATTIVKDAETRVAGLLLDFHQAAPGETRIWLSQADIGDGLGLRRTTISAASRKLEAAGGIRILRSGVRIVDPGVLRASAGQDPAPPADLLEPAAGRAPFRVEPATESRD